MTVYALAIGLGFGAGVLLIIAGLRARPVPLADVEALLARTGTSVSATRTTTGPDPTGWRIRAGRAGLAVLGRFGTDVDDLRVKLRLLDKPVETHVWEKLFAASAGFVLPVLVGVVVVVAGVAV
ncbi:MAG TPA: hypothetical protein VFK43_07770, partial [Acidimicrobiales bacterium]|nr:hypothetical protein [Acidimicrobiales bacterium]